MLNKQEQEILDNAPEGATHWMAHKIHGVKYLVESGDEFHNLNRMGIYLSEWKPASLADLRKKQGKQVWDAVNYFEGDLRGHSFVYEGRCNGMFKCNEECVNDYKFVCTVEEFNQCVKDMSEFCNVASLSDYTRATKTPLEPVKPRTRVEYVKVVDSIFHLQPDLIAGELFCNTCDGYEVIDKELTLMNALYEMNLYRKVETEIKTEKRWLVYNGKSEFCSEHDYKYEPAGKECQVIEITVEI